ncbi:Plastocyanin/azurin family domain protein [Sphingomonas sp. EC-HK361]|uniref:methylamine utilization protein n=1 Tax=Sphingomonas sp. EC-HK361 TaxID=2038397 RepID=UPI001257A3DE|nr:methylamine utilization protein [Sphingomonas sp. EC-HK361]VVT00046.1 Plastocyanin/azurin family domain protein [Sphingomonas sp. EC-HK361]
MRAILFAALAILCPTFGASVARASPVTVVVTGSDGKPLANAVVTVEVAGVPAPAPRGTYVMAQQRIAFDPHIIVVPVGATVSFPNRDKVRHHVYSFSAPKKFDLKLYGRDETKTVTFDKPGAVALGCNIHDSMSGFVFVTATPFAAISDASGRVTINGVPAGKATLSVWHPSIRAARNILSQPVAVAASGLSTAVNIRR